jgi:hypothetical protein
MTPLQVAAKFGHTATVDALAAFASPADLLLLACHRGDGPRARQIIADNPGLMASLSPADRAALSDEAWNANAPAVELMLELGFDPAAPSGSHGAGGNALHCAAWEGSVECVSAILRYPAGRALLDSRDSTYNGVPLGWCAHGSLHCGRTGARHDEVARLLIEAGAALPDELRDWPASEAVRKVLNAMTTPRKPAS